MFACTTAGVRVTFTVPVFDSEPNAVLSNAVAARYIVRLAWWLRKARVVRVINEREIAVI